MSAQPFRTGATWLTDDQLILLDVLFDRGATIRLLRRGIFHEQWNLGYVHSLDDVELKNTLHLLCEHGVLKPLSISERVSFRMTRVGGEMWSLERCPDWTRYCTEQYRDLSGGRTLMTVMAASPVVRDHFLALWPKGPAEDGGDRGPSSDRVAPVPTTLRRSCHLRRTAPMDSDRVCCVQRVVARTLEYAGTRTQLVAVCS